MKNDEIYVIGHKKPDSDSIVSAIAYAYLLNQCGKKAVAGRLGDINEETAYLLDRFGYEEPVLIEDARVRLSEIELKQADHILPDTTIFEAKEIMNQNQARILGVLDQDQKLLGVVTRSDLALLGMGDTALGIDLLKETPIELMAKTIEGKIIYKADEHHVNGKVSIIALCKTKLERYEIQDRIVIIGDDPQGQKESIEKGAGILIAVWTDHIEEDVLKAAREHNCSIIISGIGSMNTSRYLYFSIPVKLIMQKKITYFKEDEFVEDVMIKMRDTTFNTYPVLDKKDCLIGYVSRYHIMNAQNKNIIMVDHNEFSQSVNGIEKANLLEVIDHHRIHNFSTLSPIAFRNEIIGSTASIITSMFFERHIEIPENLAGLLLGAIISDGLNFQSPTTTKKDTELAQQLAMISYEDADALAYKMFSITMNLPKNISKEELIQRIEADMKIFDMKGSKVLISQVFILDLSSVRSIKEKVQEILEEMTIKYNGNLVIVAFTSIKKKGSILYGAGSKENLLWQTFGKKNVFVKDLLSRKKQIVPDLMQTFNKFS